MSRIAIKCPKFLCIHYTLPPSHTLDPSYYSTIVLGIPGQKRRSKCVLFGEICPRQSALAGVERAHGLGTTHGAEFACIVIIFAQYTCTKSTLQSQ